MSLSRFGFFALSRASAVTAASAGVEASSSRMNPEHALTSSEYALVPSGVSSIQIAQDRNRKTYAM